MKTRMMSLTLMTWTETVDFPVSAWLMKKRVRRAA